MDPSFGEPTAMTAGSRYLSTGHWFSQPSCLRASSPLSSPTGAASAPNPVFVVSAATTCAPPPAAAPSVERTLMRFNQLVGFDFCLCAPNFLPTLRTPPLTPPQVIPTLTQ